MAKVHRYEDYSGFTLTAAPNSSDLKFLVQGWDFSNSSIMFKISYISGDMPYVGVNLYTTAGPSVGTWFELTSGYKWMRLRHNTNTAYVDTSTDGIAWTQLTSQPMTEAEASEVSELEIFLDGYTADQTGSIRAEYFNDIQSYTLYTVASGNWDDEDTRIWSYTDGGLGGAIPPGATMWGGYNHDIYMKSNSTVVLTNSESLVNTINHTNGHLNLNSKTLHIGQGFKSTGSNARTLTLKGVLDVEVSAWGATPFEGFYLSGSNLSLNVQDSLIYLRCWDNRNPNILSAEDRTLNDVIINMSGTGEQLNITGSTTFRSLIIQSKNSAAHTVNIDSTIETDKFVAIGSSASNRLTLHNDTFANIVVYDSSYGQFVNADGVGGATGSATARTYLGSNSIQDVITNEWLLQDPPKISTLVDPLIGPVDGAVPPMPTGGEDTNTNWTVTLDGSFGGSISQLSSGYGGGGYRIGENDQWRIKR